MSVSIWGGDRYWGDHPSTWVQVLLLAVAQLKTALWHWLPVVLFRYSMPPNVYVEFIASLPPRDVNGKLITTSSHFASLFYPERLISRAFGLLSVACMGAYLFEDPDTNAKVLPLASGFRELPYAFIFAQSWMLIMAIILSAVVLTDMRQQILAKSDPSERLRAIVLRWSGGLLVVFMLMCIWVVIPQFHTANMIGLAVLILLPTWILCVCGKSIRTAAFLGAYVVLCALSTVHVAFNVLLLLLMAAFGLIFPGTPVVLTIKVGNAGLDNPDDLPTPIYETRTDISAAEAKTIAC